MQQQEFTGPTPAEAHRKADDWLAKQNNIRQLVRKETTAGFGGPPPADILHCIVTLWYETVGDAPSVDAAKE